MVRVIHTAGAGIVTVGGSQGGRKSKRRKLYPRSKIGLLNYHQPSLTLINCPEQTTKLEELQACIAKGWRDSILPDALLGYHILSSLGMTATERATVLTATASFNTPLEETSEQQQSTGLSLAVVEKALLSTWQDRELIERDSGLSSNPRGFQRKNHRGKVNAINDGESSDIPDSGDEVNQVNEYNSASQKLKMDTYLTCSMIH